jgi:hypothetical protein
MDVNNDQGGERPMKPDLVTGNPFPDLRLPDHTGAPRRLSLIADNHPLVLALVRGWGSTRCHHRC